MIHCPGCGNNTLVDTKKISNSKDSTIQGLNFPEGQAVAAKGFSNLLVVQCTACNQVYLHISKGVEFLLNPA